MFSSRTTPVVLIGKIIFLYDSLAYGTPMVAKFDSLFVVDAENIYSIYCKFYSII